MSYNHVTDTKLRNALALDPKLQNQYEFLLNKKDLADKALEEFLKRVEADHCQGDQAQVDSTNNFIRDPTMIFDYNAAVDYIEKYILTDHVKATEIKKYIEQQEDMEKVWEIVHKRLMNNPGMDEDGLNAFYNECVIQLEEFSKKCHQKFALMKIPLFCLERENYYKSLSKDRRSLISFIQQKVMKAD